MNYILVFKLYRCVLNWLRDILNVPILVFKYKIILVTSPRYDAMRSNISSIGITEERLKIG